MPYTPPLLLRARRFGAVLLLVGPALLVGGCETAERSAERDDAAVTRALETAATSALQQGDDATAAAQLGKLYARRPDDPRVLIPYLDVLRRIGATSDALRLADQHYRDYGNNPDFLLSVARVRVAAQRGDAALAALEDAKALQPRNWEIYSLMGVAHDSLQQPDRARAAYEAALELAPGEPVVINNLALSKAQAGDIDGAIALLRELLGRSPKSVPRIRQNLALLYGFKGNLEDFKALARFDQTDKSVERNLEAFRQMHEGGGTR